MNMAGTYSDVALAIYTAAVTAVTVWVWPGDFPLKLGLTWPANWCWFCSHKRESGLGTWRYYTSSWFSSLWES